MMQVPEVVSWFRCQEYIRRTKHILRRAEEGLNGRGVLREVQGRAGAKAEGGGAEGGGGGAQEGGGAGPRGEGGRAGRPALVFVRLRRGECLWKTGETNIQRVAASALPSLLQLPCPVRIGVSSG